MCIITNSAEKELRREQLRELSDSDAFSANAFGAKLKQLSAMKERQSEHLLDAEIKRKTAGLIVSDERCYDLTCSWMDGQDKRPNAENAQNLC